MSGNEKKCLIISGGEFFESAETEIPPADEFDLIIACDKGFSYAKKIPLIPDVVLGDFDSLGREPEITDGAEKIPQIIKLNCEKDDTDTLAAVKYAFSLEKTENIKFTEFHIVFAFGGRLDHSLANIQSASFCVEKGRRAFLYGKNEILCCISNGSIVIPKKEGFSLSVFSLSDRCTGVFERGTKYLLENAELTNKFPVGISNEWCGKTAEIGVKSGILCILLSRISES